MAEYDILTYLALVVCAADRRIHWGLVVGVRPAKRSRFSASLSTNIYYDSTVTD